MRSSMWHGVLVVALLFGGAVSSEAQDPLVDFTDLVIYYSFDEFDATVPDQSGNGLDGVVNGTITASAEGRFGSGAANFSSGSFLDLDGPNVPSGLIPTSGFTLAAWMRLDNTGGEHAIFNAQSSEGVFLTHPEVRANDYRFQLRGNQSGGSNVSIGNIITGTSTFGEWIHWAGTYDQASQTMRLYINGQVIGSLEGDDLENAVPVADDWDNGARVGFNVDNNRPLVGLMDEFYLFGRALSAAEIQALVDGPPETLEPSLEIQSNRPASQVVEGDRLELTAWEHGENFAWLKDGLFVDDDSRISGSDARTLVIDPVLPGDEGAYTCQYDFEEAQYETNAFVLASLVDSLPLAGKWGLLGMTVLLLSGSMLALRRRRQPEH